MTNRMNISNGEKQTRQRSSVAGKLTAFSFVIF